jgi:putative inorganic carbon (HCO3(-)) transporter
MPLFIALMIVAVLFLPHNVFERARSAFLMKQTSYEKRIDTWMGAFNMIKAHPALGNGINTFTEDYPKYRVDDRKDTGHAHNYYLQVTAETGLVGLAAFLFLLFMIFRISVSFIIKNLKRMDVLTAAVLGLSAGLLGAAAQSLIDTNLNSLQLAVLFWSTVGFVISAVKIKEKGGDYEKK